jgi:hypothetical protein
MQCSFLEGKRILSCRSLGAVYIPSIFELSEYCTLDRHKKCPLFCASEKKRAFPESIETGDTKTRFS